MKSNLTRIILPRRKALLTTLAALRLNYKIFSKNFIELNAQMEDLLKLAKNDSAILDKVKKMTGRIEYSDSGITSHLADIRHSIQEDIIPFFPNLKDYLGLINLIRADSVTFCGLAQVFLAGPGLFIDGASMVYDLNKMDGISHLVPEKGEFDPDQCTCPTVSEIRNPCQEIAKKIIKNRKSALRKSVLSFMTLGESNMARPFRQAFKSANALAGGETVAEIFLNNKSLIASHLWNAAQTFGKSSKEPPKIKAHYYNEYEAYTSRGIIPGISIHKYGCPKAISVIAALFGEYHEKTKYLKTIAAISAYNGPFVIEKEL